MSKTITRTLVFDRDEMRRRGRIGAKVTHAKHDPYEQTRAAREALAEKRRQAAASAVQLETEQPGTER